MFDTSCNNKFGTKLKTKLKLILNQVLVKFDTKLCFILN